MYQWAQFLKIRCSCLYHVNIKTKACKIPSAHSEGYFLTQRMSAYIHVVWLAGTTRGVWPVYCLPYYCHMRFSFGFTALLSSSIGSILLSRYYRYTSAHMYCTWYHKLKEFMMQQAWAIFLGVFICWFKKD